MFLKLKQKLLFLFALFLVFPFNPAFAEKSNIVGSTQNICSMLEGLLGPLADQNCLSQRGQAPHRKNTFIADHSKLVNADLFIQNGLGYENGYAPSLLLKAKNSSLKKIAVLPSGEIRGPIKTSSKGKIDLSDFLEEKEIMWDSSARIELKGESPSGKTPIQVDWASEHPIGNPHFLLNPEIFIRLAEKLVPFLVKLNPVQKKDIEDKSSKYIEELKKVTSEVQQKVYFMAGRRYIAYHAEFSYWKEWLHLDDVLVVESKPGVLMPSLQMAGGGVGTSEHEILKVLMTKMTVPSQTEREGVTDPLRWDGILITPFSPKALMMWLAKELNLAVFAIHTDVLDSLESQKTDFGDAPKNYVELIQSWEKSLAHPIWTPPASSARKKK